MPNYQSIWERLDRHQQNILCQAGLQEGFKVRCSEGAIDEKSYQGLVHRGLLRKYNYSDHIVTYTLTDTGADVLSTLPYDLQRDWWPLPQDIAAIKNALKNRDRDF